MLIDKLRGMIRSGLDWKKILMYGLPVVTFIIGLMVPSPLYDRLRKDPVADEKQQLVEVTGLILLTEVVMTVPYQRHKNKAWIWTVDNSR